MGKAIDKKCSVCEQIIKGSNWARHAKTHKSTVAGHTNVTKPVALARGRPLKDKKHPLDTWGTTRMIMRRGLALLEYKGTKLVRDDKHYQLAQFVRASLKRVEEGDIEGMSPGLV